MYTWRRLEIASTFILAALAGSSSWGQTPTYQIERVASGLRQPVYVDQAPGDPSHIVYYMTRVTTGGANAGSGTHGSIWRYDMNTQESTEILNLSHRNLTLDLGPQGFAFHPDFNNPGTAGFQKIYVSSAATGGPVNYVEEYAASGPGGTVPVDGGTGEPIANRTLLEYTNVFGDNNHVIDWIGFDPRAYSAPVGSPERNYLFISAGDGSNGRDAPDRPEQKANIVQGKLLRIDVDPAQPDFYPADPQKNFAIPDTNPIPLWNSTHSPEEQLVGTTLNYTTGSESYTPALPELYFTGTRNTFRMSLDRLTGDFYSGDVGEVRREEINFVRADPYNGTQPPLDFGFPQREGTGVFIDEAVGDTTIQWDLSGGGSVVADSVNPIQEGDHAPFNSGSAAGDDEIRSTARSAYIGGYVYRGPVEELQGKYFYADFVQGNIFALDFDTDIPLEDYSGTNLNQQNIPGEFSPLARVGAREVVLNRNLNSLWHTLMVDPNDPTYTPALGDDFGIGRIVSFGEDNEGNLYIVDMGGRRGDAGFGNDYPGTDTGQIFRVTPLLGIMLSVDRDTGEVTLANTSGEPIDLTGYTITSPNGAINLSAMIPVAGNYDVPIPPGDGSVDDNDSWQITSSSNAQFGEETTGDMGTLAADAIISLGGEGAWVQSIYEDWGIQVDLPNGNTVNGMVEFIGNGDAPFDRSDLDFNGQLDPDDWIQFRSNFFGVFDDMTAAESYGLGDLDGDGDNDFADFRLFQSDYIAANGEAAFQALLEVPEPTTGLLALSAIGLLGMRRRHRQTRLGPIRRVPTNLATAVGAAAFALAAPSAYAELVHQYTFNDETVMDSVGGAHGSLEGNTSISLGVANLPGGDDDFIDLPGGAIDIDEFTDATFEAWFTYSSGNSWQRVFDFGRTTFFGGQGRDYIFFSPIGGGGDHRAVITDDGSGDEDIALASPALNQDQLFHVAVVVDDSDSNLLSLYIDGQLADSTSLTVSMSDLSNDNAYLGNSNWVGDASLTGTIDEFRIYNHALSASEVETSFLNGPIPLASMRIEVNTVTGAVSLLNDHSSPVTIDHYAIRSEGGALDASGWTSLEDQDIGFGDDAGEGWEEADLSDSFQLGELFLLGATTVANDAPMQLGQAFDPSVFGEGNDGDLTFEFAIQGGDAIQGDVTYVHGLPGDFDGNMLVDGADFIEWQRGFGDLYDASDLADWEANLGASAGSAPAATVVPEPATLTAATLASAFVGWGYCAARRPVSI